MFVATDRQETENGFAHKNIYQETNTGKQLLAYNMGTWPPGGVETDYDGLGITIVDKGDGMIVI